MADEKAAKKYKEIALLIDSEMLSSKMQPYYDLIDTAKQSAYGRFISSTDMSVKSLKECIKTEATMLDAVNENVCLGVQRQDVIDSLKPLYKEFKKSVNKHTEKPPFFHVNSLRNADVFFTRFVSFAPPLLKFDTDDNMVICNDLIPLPGIRDLVREIEKKDSCKLSRLTFKDLGEATVDNTLHENLTYIEVRFEVE